MAWGNGAAPTAGVVREQASSWTSESYQVWGIGLKAEKSRAASGRRKR